MADFFDMTKWVNQAREAISPATPTYILYLGHSLYEARWLHKSIPDNELKALRKISYIQIVKEPFVLSDFPDWIAIQFVWRR